MAQGQASRLGAGGCVTKGGLSLAGAERVDFGKSGCCSWVMSCGSAGEAGLLLVTLCGWHHPRVKQETCGMRLGASAAPKSLQASIPILSHELHPCLCKHSMAQTIPEGSPCKAIPGCSGCCVLLAALSWKLSCFSPAEPGLHAQAGPGSPTACCPRPWGKVIWYRTCICTGAPEWLWGLCPGGDQVWEALGSLLPFSPLHLSS